MIGLLVIVTIARFPPLGRGSWSSKRDPWRGYRFAARREVFERAGGRCEAAFFVIWGRCREDAVEADHVYPWSKGGATIVSNAQALCRTHNRSKGAITPPWWYVLGLERRRRTYVQTESTRCVRWEMSVEDRALRHDRV
nr:HNH endonuclease signature motif containing protein [Leucobacter denitrificans]